MKKAVSLREKLRVTPWLNKNVNKKQDGKSSGKSNHSS